VSVGSAGKRTQGQVGDQGRGREGRTGSGGSFTRRSGDSEKMEIRSEYDPLKQKKTKNHHNPQNQPPRTATWKKNWNGARIRVTQLPPNWKSLRKREKLVLHKDRGTKVDRDRGTSGGEGGIAQTSP